MKLPVYIKPDVPYKDAPKASMFTESGEKIESGELMISFRPNGGAQVSLGDSDTITFSKRFWEEVQKDQDKGYFIKIDRNGDRVWAGKRKFVLAQLEEEEEEIPIEDIEIETTRLENITFDPRLFVPIKTANIWMNFGPGQMGFYQQPI